MSQHLSDPAVLDPLLDRLAAPFPNGENGAAAPSPNGANGGRDTRGRFVPGNPGGPGNPFARRVASFRKAVCEAVNEEDFRDLAARLLREARHGDLAAVKLLFAYTIGRPGDPVDPDTLDIQEWALMRRSPLKPEEMTPLLRNVPLPLALALLRIALPCVAATYGERIQQMLHDADEKPPRKPRPRKARAGRKGGSSHA
jgi:hypothetical protein